VSIIMVSFERRFTKALALMTATALALSPSAASAQSVTYVNDRLTAAPTAGAAPRAFDSRSIRRCHSQTLASLRWTAVSSKTLALPQRTPEP
jgi:hypothetical protein